MSFQTVRLFFMMGSFSALFTLMGFMLECHLSFCVRALLHLYIYMHRFLTYMNSLTYSEV